MTVRELIEQLQAMPQDLEVAWTEEVQGQGGSYMSIHAVRTATVTERGAINTYMADRSGGQIVLLKTR